MACAPSSRKTGSAFRRKMEKVTARQVEHWWPDIERLAAALLQHDWIEGVDVQRIIAGRPNLRREHRENWAAWAEFMADKELP